MSNANDRREAKGFGHAQQIMSGSALFRQALKLTHGERARFWFLSDGWDEYLDAGKFHKAQEAGATFARNYLCLDSYTRKQEGCKWCDEGNTSFTSRFAVWVWVESLLHPSDNPDPEGEPWGQVKMKDGDRVRVMYRQYIRAPRVIHMSAGFSSKWYNMFHQAYLRTGNLQKHQYELLRIGKGMQDTDYTLRQISETPISEEVLAEREGLPSIEELFRGTVGGPASAARAAATAQEEFIPAEDDLIELDPAELEGEEIL